MPMKDGEGQPQGQVLRLVRALRGPIRPQTASKAPPRCRYFIWQRQPTASRAAYQLTTNVVWPF